MYLLLKTAAKPYKRIVAGQSVEVPVGAVLTSRSTLSADLGMTEKQARTALTLLEKLEIVTIKRASKYSMVFFVNWHRYQQRQPAEGPADSPTDGPGGGQVGAILKEVKNINTPTLSSLRSERASPTAKTFPQEFLDFWAAYPKKTGKDAAYRAWQTKKRERRLPAIDDLLEAVRKAKASSQWQEDGGKYIPNPSTWLNQGRWEDEAVEDSAPRGKPLYLRDPDFWRKTQ
jgi:hypothetical protein